MNPLVFIAVAVLAYALLSKRLASTIITAPIFFAGLGFLAGPMLDIVVLHTNDQALILLLEAALVMVLFADSSGLDVRRWTRSQASPVGSSASGSRSRWPPARWPLRSSSLASSCGRPP